MEKALDNSNSICLSIYEQLKIILIDLPDYIFYLI